MMYALVFGTAARDARRPDSDVDIALELQPGAPRDPRALGRIVAALESASGLPVDLVLLDEAPAPLAYRVFRDGQLLLERSHAALTARKARAILDYLDFQPLEARCAEGVLRAARLRGR